MPMTAIACGVLLIIIGIAGYANGLMTERASLTALIPAVFGALLAVFGYIAGAKEDLRKHMMHAAAAVALIGFLLTAGRLLPRLGELTASAAVLSQAAMSIVCLIFVLLAVKSFIDARKANTGT
jgi:glucan phosphoethanolaminetransferase (alkaline phosphatase superfamily)